MHLIDTHAHIHSSELFDHNAAEAVLARAVKAGVDKIICVGTGVEDSEAAAAFADAHPQYCWASIGIHPHEATEDTQVLQALAALAPNKKIKVVGECGLDFYYNDRSSSFKKQETTLRFQIELALEQDIPLIFHVREAFVDFWPIFDSYQGIRGVLHSFTDKTEHLEKALERNLTIGINGIATFTTHKWQQELYRQVPLENIVLETDSPFLTPIPKRGNINEPENVIYITKYLAELRGESEETVADVTTHNAQTLFNLT